MTPHNGVGNREGIAAQQVDVLEDQRVKAERRLRVDGIAFTGKLIPGCFCQLQFRVAESQEALLQNSCAKFVCTKSKPAFDDCTAASWR